MLLRCQYRAALWRACIGSRRASGHSCSAAGEVCPLRERAVDNIAAEQLPCSCCEWAPDIGDARKGASCWPACRGGGGSCWVFKGRRLRRARPSRWAIAARFSRHGGCPATARSRRLMASRCPSCWRHTTLMINGICEVQSDEDNRSR